MYEIVGFSPRSPSEYALLSYERQRTEIEFSASRIRKLAAGNAVWYRSTSMSTSTPMPFLTLPHFHSTWTIFPPHLTSVLLATMVGILSDARVLHPTQQDNGKFEAA